MVNIKDVAAAAGVSDKTVSRVVNREPNVKPAMIARVQAAIDQLGYIPNNAARMVRTNRSRIIGVLTDVVSTTPNSVEIIHGIQDRVAETGNSLLIANTGNDPAAAAGIWRTFREHRIDGVLFATMYHRNVTLPDIAYSAPVVLVNCFSNDRPDTISVVPDDYQGGYEAARYAIDQGHRAIAFLTLNPEILAARLRRQAFADALEAHAIPLHENWVLPAVTGSVGEEALCVREVLQSLLSSTAETPTAILCGNDEIALQATCLLHQWGKRVPQDIAIIGFDDFQLISTRMRPALTTVALPYYQIGVQAADRLFSLLAGSAEPGGIERVACPMVRRESA